MENKRVLVIGGTGYIGKEVVSSLAKKGYDVAVLSRHTGNSENVRYLKASVLDKPYLLQFLKDFDLVIYMAAVVRTLNKSKYKQNIIGLQNTIEAMRHNEIKKMLYFSTQNIYIPKTGPYGNSKKECEKIVKESELDYVIARPNYVYGIDKENNFYRLYKIMRLTRLVPLIGKGRNKVQPINKKDVASMTLKIVEGWESREEVDFSGKTTISLLQVADLIKRRTKMMALIIHLPLFLLKALKFIVPFDVDGYDFDRVSPETAHTFLGSSDIEEDINEIIEL